MMDTAEPRPDHDVWRDAFQRYVDAFRAADPRTVAVLAVHFAVEQELDVCLAHFLARPDKLGALKFGHKVRVLQAVCPDPYLDHFASSCIALDHLRNSLAHNNRPEIESCMRRFLTTTELADFKPEPTLAGIEAAGRSLVSGLTFIRVENFAYQELQKPIGHNEPQEGIGC
ncbi:hypothetical protein DDF62_07015 [Caulobacter radicis]|uniref:hypothetical protein n=1 Tax=Caulobacter radicis TaxID=2172650 RepID=UPI000D571829|nr:hypothetical protein [Caulobacter radicis]PVM91766.1 hypothetical protein DDF62_07015 [Caulobacter radicis]